MAQEATEKEKTSEVEKPIDFKYWKEVICSGKKRNERWVEYYENNNQLYNGERKPVAPIDEFLTYTTVPNINEYYGDTEIQRAEGFKNPVFNVKAKQNKFFIISQDGSPDRKSVPNFNPEILKFMEMQNVNSYRDPQSGVTYTVLDGTDSANTAEHALNYFVREKNLKQVMQDIKDDKIHAGIGAIWIDVCSSDAIPINETEYIKNNDIYVERVKLSDIIIDPCIKRPSDLHKAKFIMRRYFKTYQDLADMASIKMADGSSFFETNSIAELLKGKESKVYNYSNPKEAESDKEKSEKDSKYNTEDNGVYIWQVWQKPTLSEKYNANNEFSNGKIFYLAEDKDVLLTKIRPWISKIDGFPLELYWDNCCNDRFFPSPDVSMYESLLYQRNLFRYFEIKQAEKVSTDKVVSSIPQDILNKLKEPGDQYVNAPEFKKEDIFSLQTSSPSDAFFALSERVRADKQRSSLTSDTQKGISTTSGVSATEVAENSRAMSSRSAFRMDILADFWCRVGKKILQYMKQYYTIPRMVLITGETEPEWSDYFTKDDIQGDYFVDIDIMSLNPVDEISKRRDLNELMNIIVSIYRDKGTFLKILSEGNVVNISDTLKSIFKLYDNTNEKIFPKIDEETANVAGNIILNSLGIGGINGGGNGGVPNTAPSTEGQNPPVGSVSGGQLPPGQVMPPGGGNKLR